MFESSVSHVSHDDFALHMESKESMHRETDCWTERKREREKERKKVLVFTVHSATHLALSTSQSHGHHNNNNKELALWHSHHPAWMGVSHRWVPVKTHSTPVLPKREEAVGCSTSHNHEPNGSATVQQETVHQCQHGSGAVQIHSTMSSQTSRSSVVGITRSWSWNSRYDREGGDRQTFLGVSNADQSGEVVQGCVPVSVQAGDQHEQWWLCAGNRCRSLQMSRDKMTTTSVHLNDHTVSATAFPCLHNCNRDRFSSSCCAEDRVDSQIQYQRCRRFRRLNRFHKCGSWTRLASRQKIVETAQMQFLGKVVDIPVVVQHQVSMIQVVMNTAWKKSSGQLQDEFQGECKQLQLSADSSRKQITMCSWCDNQELRSERRSRGVCRGTTRSRR